MTIELRRRHQRRFIVDIAALALFFFSAAAYAADGPQAKRSFSSGHFAGAEAIEGAKPDVANLPSTKQREAVSQSLASGFYVYDAQATLLFDDDRDGFYYGLDVTFDADTDFIAAEVYARLYLSYENGPWEEYFTTDYFTIFGASGLDDYVVETELFDGYPTGYYDVLIELYDSYGDLVASFGPLDTSELSLLPLEDQQKDAPFVETVTVSASSGGGGAAGLPLAAGLALLAWRRRKA